MKVEVELDSDGYPTERFLESVRQNAQSGTFDVLDVLFDLAEKSTCAWYEESTYFLEEWLVGFHTGGCSGNEEVVAELQKTISWMLCWQATVRGGHYYFKRSLS